MLSETKIKGQLDDVMVSEKKKTNRVMRRKSVRKKDNTKKSREEVLPLISRGTQSHDLDLDPLRYHLPLFEYRPS